MCVTDMSHTEASKLGMYTTMQSYSVTVKQIWPSFRNVSISSPDSHPNKQTTKASSSLQEFELEYCQ